MIPKLLKQEDLKVIQAKVDKDKELTPKGRSVRIAVHMGTCGIASGAQPVYEALQEELKKSKRKDIAVFTSGCIGLCSQEPLVTVESFGMEPIIYSQVDPDIMKKIFKEHVVDKKVVVKHALARGLAINEESPKTDSPWKKIPHISQVPFFGKQRSWVLKNRGVIDPENLEDYIWRGGYQAAAKALISMQSQDIISEIKASGLRGRGGGGFPTGLKWDFAAASKNEMKYVLCNADEGDPGAFMDRSVMEGDPHAVLEGMIIAAKAIGAKQGYIYCRAEYPLAVNRLNLAIKQCREHGLLGKNILNSGFNFDIDIYQGAGAFVCGEETALMASIEGRRGMPRPRPPFPAVSGLWKKPTILNNVETYSAVPQIVLRGSDAFSSLGTEASKGTKVFALTGKVNNIGLVEVPMGTSLRQIIYEIGGGIPQNKRFKAAQLGGPSGGCIPTNFIDTATDYEEISKVGAIMGSGGLIVMDEDTCMVDMARYFMDFCQDESCGKCTPCRVGTKRMLEVLERMCRGEGREGDIELLEEFAVSIKDAALCGLGQTAPNPILSTIRYFRKEYEDHIAGYCSANVCKAISPAPCQKACPIGMDVPSYNALIAWGRLEEALEVMHKDNPFPAVCGRICPKPCETKCVRTENDKSVAIRSLKRFVSDQIMEAFPRKAEKVPVTQKEKIAVVGAGPCGITAASDLARLGYAVTVFEARKEAGGMLRHAIPDFRLSPAVVEREIDYLSPLFTLQTGKTLGKDITVSSLKKDGFSSVLLALGAPKNSDPVLAKAAAKGDYLDGVKFLQDAKKGKAPKMAGTVVVMGSGHLAFDSARTALRLGASEAVILYGRGKEAFPAEEEELKDLKAEGGRIEYNCVPAEIIKKDSKVKGIKCLKTAAQGIDDTGRKRTGVIEGSDYTINCSAVIASVGQKPDSGALKSEKGIRIGVLDNVLVDPVSLETGLEGVFAAGDLVTAGATVIEAIAAGQKAAVAIHRSLRGLPQETWYKRAKPRLRVEAYQAEGDQPETARAEDPRIKGELRKTTFQEVVCKYTLAEAQGEARRCLRCDLD